MPPRKKKPQDASPAEVPDTAPSGQQQIPGVKNLEPSNLSTEEDAKRVIVILADLRGNVEDIEARISWLKDDLKEARKARAEGEARWRWALEAWAKKAGKSVEEVLAAPPADVPPLPPVYNVTINHQFSHPLNLQALPVPQEFPALAPGESIDDAETVGDEGEEAAA